MARARGRAEEVGDFLTGREEIWDGVVEDFLDSFPIGLALS